jgi:hypothetical protein
MSQAQVPPAVAAYFGTDAYGFPLGEGIAANRRHPIIVQHFTPEKGWKRHPIRKRVSVSWLRKLRAEGVTDVALSSGGRTADFRVAELLRHR